MFGFRLLSFINVPRALLSFVLLVGLSFILSVQGVVQAAGSVGGTVFRDYNADGTQNAGEPGVAGVTVNAFGAAGLVAGPIVSGPGGVYSISWVSADVTVRLEFSGLPGTSQQGAFGANPGSGTSVQFVTDAAVANYGINRPDDYCQNVTNLELVTSCFVQGDQAAAGATDFALVSHNYQTPGALGHPALANQIGTVWGLAYQRSTQTIFAGAYAKRQAGYAPTGGPGTIWRVPPGAPGVPPTILATLPNAGATLHTAPFVQDANFFDAVGKEGLGDIDISDDGLTLFAINLGDRQLYSVSIPAAGAGVATARGIIGNPACTNGVYRPFGLTVRDGLVYIGGVCTGETAALGDSSGLQAFVFEFNPVTNATRQVLNFPLTYPRGCADIDPGYGAPVAPITCKPGLGTEGALADWQPWRNIWPTPNATPPGTGFAPGGQNFFAYAQPMLVDIEFVNDDMVLAFRDRMGDQIGNLDTGPDGLGTTGGFPDDLTVVTAGDILRASPLGTVWALETAGANAVGAGVFGPSAGATNEQGPGNGEFFFGDNFGNFHDETLSGGLAQIPGQPEIAAIVMDPERTFTAGTLWLNNTSGARSRQFEILPPTPAFGKGGGLGDLEPLCNAAPIEIGNYVWNDTDNDGIQDPNELPIAGVVVQLFNPGTGAVVATATTDAQGRYIFSSNPAGATTGSFIYNLPILPATAYQVRIDLSAAANPNLVGFSPSPANVSFPTNAVRDSNGQTGITAGFSVAPVTTGIAGQNDHTIDFGFNTIVYSLGNRVWRDVDNSGNINPADGAAPGIGLVVVNLLTGAGAPTGQTATTDANGYYRFDNLAAGDYIVEIAAANFGAGQPLNGLASSTGALQEADPDTNGDSNDNGLDVPVAGAIRSAAVTLGPGDSEPTGELDLPTPNPPGEAPDARSNLTVDFGFNTPLVFSLGNRVWRDVDNSGHINPADGAAPGIAGVVVNLLTGAGVPTGQTATTDANGYYRFDNLLAGDYIVEIAAANFGAGQPLNTLTSSTGALQEADPDTNGDSNDNGLDVPVGGAIRSAAVTLGPTANEPTGAQDADAPTPNPPGEAPDAQSNRTVDFGFNPPLVFSLGNRVWRDVDNSGNINAPDGAAPGIGLVVVNLLTGAGVPTGQTATTDANGYYRFDNLPAGDYIVEIAAGNFGAGQPLNGFTSSTGAAQEADPDTNGDNNDNGLDVPVGGAIRSAAVTLGPTANEPTGELDLATPNPPGEAPNAQSNLTVDFGFNPPVLFSLGNRVWRDVDNSGHINPADGGAPGIAGVTVNLLTGAGVPTGQTTTTDANGYYRFDNLAAGDYIVEIDAANFGAGQPLLNLTSSTGALQEADPDTNGDNNDNGLDVPVGGAIRSAAVTLGPTANEPTGDTDAPTPNPPGEAPDAQSNRTVDFGFFSNLYSLGNRVWRDVDNNGTINAPDGAAPGIAGVVVNLLDGTGAATGQTTTTDANGYYRFDALPAGNYIVEIAAANFGAGQPLLNLTSSTGALQEANPNTDGDNNDNGLDVPVGGAIRSGVVTLGPGLSEPTTDTDAPTPNPPGEASNAQSNRTVDFGFFSNLYSLGNRVWLDNGVGGGTANNGVQDGTEPGIFNVTVNLLDGLGVPTGQTTTTDANGYYRFDNLPSGAYIVEIPAANFTGPLLNLASSSDTANTPNPNSDIDRDDNGIGTGAGVDIRSGVVNLGPGLSEPQGDADAPTPNPPGEASNPQSNRTIDFGFFNNLYSLGNRVWLDNGAGGGIPNDGRQNGTEPGIGGVTVNLLDSAGNPVLDGGGNPITTTTDTTGYYRFDNLPAGQYIVEIAAGNFGAGQPLANLASTADVPTTPNPDSDIDRDDNGIGTGTGAAIRSGVVNLGPGTTEPINETDLGPGGSGPSANNQSNLTVDFGFFSNLYSLGNRVWLDNGAGGGIPDNGVQDGAELGIAGVTVNLLDGLGAPTGQTTTTDTTGYYLFDNLAAGTFIVEIPAANFTGPLLNLSSSTDTANTPNPDSNIDRDDNGIGTGNGVDIRSGVVNLGPGASEPTTETDLGPGGSGLAANNQSNLTVDFGFFNALYSLGNRVWLDNGNGGGVSNNGVMDGGEAGIPGVTVNLLDGAGNPVLDGGGNPITATTDASGYYRFDNLPPGPYIVEIDAGNFTGPLQGLSSSTDTGNTPNPDSDIDRDDNGIGTGTGLAVRSGVVNLGPGGSEPTTETDLGPGGSGTSANNRSNLTVDFGFFGETYALGNRVWYDDNATNPALVTNNDGALNAGEFGFDGVTVNLYRATAPAVIVATTTTQCGGYYQFNNLTTGDYIVEIPASNFAAGAILNGLTNSTGALQEADPNTDGDSNDNGIDVPSGTAVRSAAVTLGPGGSEPVNDTDITACIAATATNDHTNLSVDFGFFGTPVTYSLGNRVWLDNNNSGAIDPGEVGVGNVVLNLFTVVGGVPSGAPLRTTSTNPSGYYLFDNLPAGDYVVGVAASNCVGGGPLVGLSNSTGAAQEANPNNDGDSNDNGLDSSGTCGVRSGIVTLGEGTGTQEPINETDLGPLGSGIAANNRSNLTVDFGYFGATVSPPSGVPGGPARVDPIIGKIATPPFGLPGDRVLWTITVTNPSSVVLNNVGFTDPVPGELEIIQASVQGNNGTVTVNGQTVTYIINVLNPGQSVVVTILTRVRQGVTVPFDISNTATLSNGYVGSAGDRVISVGSLPATGETPWWRLPLLLIVGEVMLLIAARVLAARAERHGAGD